MTAIHIGRCLVVVLCLPLSLLADGAPVAFNSEYGHERFALSPDGKQLALIGSGVFRIGDPHTGKITLENDRNTPLIVDLCWFANGKQIVTAGEGIHIWDASKLILKTVIATPDSVRRAVISPDQKLIAAGQGNGDILLIDVAQEETIATLTGHKSQPNCLAWSNDGTRLFSAGGYNEVEIRSWDAVRKLPLGSISVARHEVTYFTFGPDEKSLYVLSDGELISEWNLKLGRKVREFPGAAYAKVIAVSPEGKTIVGNHENDVQLWGAQGKPLRKLQGHDNWVDAIQFSNDGSLLITGGGTSVLVWKMGAATNDSKAYQQSGEERASLSTDNFPVQHVSLSRNGRWLAAAVDSDPVAHVYVWNAETLELHAKIPAGAPVLHDAHFRRDSKLLYQHSNGEMVVWEAGRKKEMRRLDIHDTDGEFGISRGPDHKLAIGSVRGEILIADGVTGETIRRFPAHTAAISGVDITQDGTLVASGSHDETARIWEAATGKLVDTLPRLPGTHMTYHAVAFSPDDTLLAAGNDNAVIVWDVVGHKLRHMLAGHRGYCRCLGFSPDGKWLVTGGDDNLVKIWDVDSGNQLKALKGHTDMIMGVAVSADGKTIASGGFDKSVKLWDVAGLMTEPAEVPPPKRDSN
ncbi:MAG: hypothetical protein KDA90_16510 [Planctomycetaceae bacterium]|nr:hypothetical protein [Planctomycetaceae bacterium]